MASCCIVTLGSCLLNQLVWVQRCSNYIHEHYKRYTYWTLVFLGFNFSLLMNYYFDGVICTLQIYIHLVKSTASLSTKNRLHP